MSAQEKISMVMRQKHILIDVKGDARAVHAVQPV